MPEAEIAKAVQLLDLMLEFFADDGHWPRGRYDDGNGGHCLVGALLHLSRQHRLPTAPVIASCRMRCRGPGFRSYTSTTIVAAGRRVALRHPQGALSRARYGGTRARRCCGEGLAARPDREKTSRGGGRYRAIGGRRTARQRTPRRLTAACRDQKSPGNQNANPAAILTSSFAPAFGRLPRCARAALLRPRFREGRGAVPLFPRSGGTSPP